MVDSAARYAVKHERVGVVYLFCVVYGKFAVACVLVGIMLDERNVDAFGFFERIEIAEYDVGRHRAYVETSVATYDFVAFDFALYFASAI